MGATLLELGTGAALLLDGVTLALLELATTVLLLELATGAMLPELATGATELLETAGTVALEPGMVALEPGTGTKASLLEFATIGSPPKLVGSVALDTGSPISTELEDSRETMGSSVFGLTPESSSQAIKIAAVVNRANPKKRLFI